VVVGKGGRWQGNAADDPVGIDGVPAVLDAIGSREAILFGHADDGAPLAATVFGFDVGPSPSRLDAYLSDGYECKGPFSKGDIGQPPSTSAARASDGLRSEDG
jgi:hypothetical protein